MSELFLCGGLQSSGSTLLSWCFLQRGDTDGTLDARYDLLPSLPAGLGRPYAWCKITIACFRLSEVAEHLEAAGWHVRPLLVVRDPRSVWTSLQGKPWGLNATTAEDPPLRLRLLRFLDDWHAARARGWPIVVYEDFVARPRETLVQTLRTLDLPWDEAMMSWPKPPSAVHEPSSLKRLKRGESLEASLPPSDASRPLGALPPRDHAWIEHRFRELLQAHDYPEHRPAASHAEERLVPSYERARRVEWKLARKPLRYLGWKLRRRLGLPLGSAATRGREAPRATKTWRDAGP